jgi:hypothetical protein
MKENADDHTLKNQNKIPGDVARVAAEFGFREFSEMIIDSTSRASL